jgi:hypothetical protein
MRLQIRKKKNGLSQEKVRKERGGIYMSVKQKPTE